MMRPLIPFFLGLVAAYHVRAQVAAADIRTLFAAHPELYADGFDFPVGPPDGKKYYNAQGFGKNSHLGDDWNGTGGGNTDLGAPVHTCANGMVVFAQDIGGGWGNVVRIVHVVSENPLVVTESLYAHLNDIRVTEGAPVKRGDRIGTAGGIYPAHLYFEIRTEYGMPVGGGYAADTVGYADPTAYIRAHRPKR